MQLVLNSFPEAMFFLVFVTAIGILLFTFGRLILRDFREMDPITCITAKQVDAYLREHGYVVCNITPVKNTNQWLAFLVKNGEYLIATVFTSRNGIEGHKDSLI
jgi:hypothetical protein